MTMVQHGIAGFATAHAEPIAVDVLESSSSITCWLSPPQWKGHNCKPSTCREAHKGLQVWALQGQEHCILQFQLDVPASCSMQSPCQCLQAHALIVALPLLDLCCQHGAALQMGSPARHVSTDKPDTQAYLVAGAD
jgi:hypothetical protein